MDANFYAGRRWLAQMEVAFSETDNRESSSLHMCHIKFDEENHRPVLAITDGRRDCVSVYMPEAGPTHQRAFLGPIPRAKRQNDTVMVFAGFHSSLSVIFRSLVHL